MPNWTHNIVRFEGSKNKIKELKKKLESKDNVFDFNKIIPMPPNSKDFKATGNISSEQLDSINNWYRWSSDNWGTKWNSVRSEISSESGNHIEYIFDTAWDAPRPIAKAIREFSIDLTTSDDSEQGSGVSWSCMHEFEEEPEILI